MIKKLENGFILNTKNTTYAFRVLKTGHLEHLYYGKKIAIENMEPLIEQHNFMPGNTVAYNQKTMEYSLENIRLEMSSYGKGDVREPFVEVVKSDGSFTNDFTYADSEISWGKQPFETLPGSYDEDGNVDHLTVTLKDNDLVMELHYYVYENCDVITRSTVLINKGKEKVNIKRLMSMQLDMFGMNYVMTTFNGSWANEMNRHDTKVAAGRFANYSYAGTSSNRANPFVMISREETTEDFGECIGTNLIYSGNHYEAMDVCSFNKTRFVSGINPQSMSYGLLPGEKFEAPESVLTYSKKGYNGMSQNMHKFVREHIVRGKWKYKERPVLLNSWEANYFDITEEKLINLAKAGKDIGIELFVMDDGWFGKRNDDTSSLGDWYVNKDKLPNGLAHLVDEINKIGLDFGIWIEPEMINKNSELYKKHPNWVLENPNAQHSEGRNQCMLDLTNSEVVDYMIKEISNILSSANISYVKWDMNRIFSDYYSAGLSYESQGEVPHRYVLGFYKMAKALTEKFPEILFEGCCGGGNRFDLGMLCYFPQIWASDDTDAVCRVNIQNGYSYGYPMSTVGAHVSACPNHQTLRTTPIDTRYNVACFGVLGYECDLTKMSKEDLFLIKKQIEEYKKWRKVLQFGEFYRGKSPYENSQDSDSNNVYQWTCVSADKKKAVGMLFRKIIKPNDQFLNFRPKALAENKEYHFYNRPVYHNKKDMGHFVYENNEIKSNENLSKDEVSFVAENFVKGETEDYIAYGSLLNEAGVNLKEGFAGIGINGDTRIMKDFDSRLYYMEEVE